MKEKAILEREVKTNEVETIAPSDNQADKIQSRPKRLNLEQLRNGFNNSTEQAQEPDITPTQNIVVETPNYDLLPELEPEKQKVILKIESEVASEKPKPKSKLKRILAALSLAVALGLGIFTAVDLGQSVSAFNAAETQYSINVATLMQKIASIDSGNKTSQLFETFPSELTPPESIGKDSNWFDRLCNFLSGLFGG